MAPTCARGSSTASHSRRWVAWCAQRGRIDNSRRSRSNNPRITLGTVKTTWRWATGLSTSSTRCYLLELVLKDGQGDKLANVVFADIKDRKERSIFSIRIQNTFAEEMRKKRLMTLIHVFLIHRYRAVSVHYVSPTEDNHYQTQKMMKHGIFSDVHSEVGQMIVADVNSARIAELIAPDTHAMMKLIDKTGPPSA